MLFWGQGVLFLSTALVLIEPGDEQGVQHSKSGTGIVHRGAMEQCIAVAMEQFIAATVEKVDTGIHKNE